ncbi:hypothetical protein B296_00006547 [Ensete ventricosum]|uniref:Uncharacterized protein n=1 Tax=Ensete ventricosum TaxID=4639 RepID=A0A427BAL8_ENSVE|nr:hypothetical protein B296_00006547 [Ensete ventricosum]
MIFFKQGKEIQSEGQLKEEKQRSHPGSTTDAIGNAVVELLGKSEQEEQEEEEEEEEGQTRRKVLTGRTLNIGSLDSRPTGNKKIPARHDGGARLLGPRTRSHLHGVG